MKLFLYPKDTVKSFTIFQEKHLRRTPHLNKFGSCVAATLQSNCFVTGNFQ